MLEGLSALRRRFAALPLSARFGLITLVIAALGYWGVTTVMTRNPFMTVLFSSLAEEDAAHIVDRLRAANIPYRLEAGGTTILVPESTVYETRLMLTSEGLPSGGGVGFEVFDTQRFGESEFAEQVKYHRALEGELSRTISHLAGVQSARVHLVLPSRTLFAATEQGATASVVLHLKPGFRIRDDQIKGIVHLVASSVRDLVPEHVTLVDGNGKKLGSQSSGDGEHGDSDTFRRELELSKERAAQQLLDATLGPGKSIVRVSATVNMAREEWTEERFDPQSTATRSFQTNDEKDGAQDNTVAGVPGAPSNLPGAEAPTATPVGKAGTARRSETRNFEISKVLRKMIEPVGRLVNMQVAVVVDGNWVGEKDKRTFVPLPQAELDRIAHMVAPAIGVDEKRGDKLVVECVPFPATPLDVGVSAEKPAWPPWAIYAAIGGGALFLILLLVGLVKLFKRKPAALPAGALPRALGDAGARAASGANMLSASELMNAASPNALPEETMEQVRVMAADLASREPEAAARVIRGWLNEGKT